MRSKSPGELRDRTRISRAETLRGGFQNPVARQPPGIRGPWRSFPVPPARGGGHGVEGGGVGGGDHRPAGFTHEIAGVDRLAYEINFRRKKGRSFERRL